MRKTIYFETAGSLKGSIDNYGLFESMNFKEYMDKYKGAEFVGGHIANAGKDHVLIYHIEPQGVTAHHEESEEGQVLVTLFGKEEGIGEVEKKILESSKNFSNLPKEL